MRYVSHFLIKLGKSKSIYKNDNVPSRQINKSLELIIDKAQHVAFMIELNQYKIRRMYRNEFSRTRHELDNSTVPSSSRESIRNRVAHLETLGLPAVDNNKCSGMDLF